MRIRAIDPREVMVGSDFICGRIAEDESGAVLMAMAAVARPEVHMTSSDFGTPGARWELLQLMHEQMEGDLKRLGFTRLWTWFRMADRFCKRLLSLDWCKSESVLYYKELR